LQAEIKWFKQLTLANLNQEAGDSPKYPQSIPQLKLHEKMELETSRSTGAHPNIPYVYCAKIIATI